MEVNDVLIFDGSAFKVVGVYLAPPGGQSLIGLTRLTSRTGSQATEHRVPVELIRGLPIYREVD